MTAKINNYHLEGLRNVNTEPANKAEINTPSLPAKTPGSTNSKVMIGLGALAAAAIAGISIKKLHPGKIAKDVQQEFYSQLDKSRLTRLLNQGETVEETIKNVLGEGTRIKPHSYDLSKESPVIAAYRDFGGYKDGVVCKEGSISWVKGNKQTNEELFMLETIGNFNGWLGNADTIPIGKTGAYIQKGIVKQNGVNRAVTALNVPDYHAGRHSIFNIFIASPNREFTPAQQDLLKLAETPEKFDKDVFDRITTNHLDELNRKGIEYSREERFANSRKYANLDYDLVLSAIQSMAK